MSLISVCFADSKSVASTKSPQTKECCGERFVRSDTGVFLHYKLVWSTHSFPATASLGPKAVESGNLGVFILSAHLASWIDKDSDVLLNL